MVTPGARSKPPHRSRSTSRRPPIRRAVQIVFLLAAFGLFVNGLVGDDGLIDSMAARRQHRRLVQDVERLRVENERLREEAGRLRDDPAAIEEVARDELGLIAPGEIVFHIRERQASTHER